jgi:hypothetical protein
MKGSINNQIQQLCNLCSFESIDKVAPVTYRINGIGTTWLGSNSICPRCGSSIRTHWFTVFWIPVVPLGKYRLLQLTEQTYYGRKLSTLPKDKPWWNNTMSKLNKDLVPLAVIKPRSDNSPEQYRIMGELLRKWQASNAQVQHIWGLDDLLACNYPRSPCEYFQISRSLQDLRDGHEAVALVMVLNGAPMNDISDSLNDCLQVVKANLSSLSDLDNYCYQNR